MSEQGDLANWIVPGKMVKGMGRAMDLVAAPSRKIVTMNHECNGDPKVVKECTLPITGRGVVDLLITELGVFDFGRESMTLIEIAKGLTVDELKAKTPCKFEIASDLKEF